MSHNTTTPDHTSAKAACEAGYLSVADYVALCKKYGWVSDE